MRKIRFSIRDLAVAAMVAAAVYPSAASAAVGNDYCIIPSFIKAFQPPNLLLMLDNSSSMYDLAYTDQGSRDNSGSLIREPNYCVDQTYRTNYCSGDHGRSCTADSECASGQTCQNVYAGYFQSNQPYQYDFTNNYFYIPASAPDGATCDKYVTNTLCLNFDGTGNVTRFVARGNYLNWLTSSKLDVEKKVLTGGKYVSGNLVKESRGCVGQGFVKKALTADFVDYAAGAANPNTSLDVVFVVKGPVNSANPSAPSPGGQTSIEIYRGTYNDQVCDDAVTLWNTPNAQKTELQNAVEGCINYSSTGGNKCSSNSALTCAADADCIVTTAAVAGKCRVDSTISCTSNAGCLVPGAGTAGKCDYNTAITCWKNDDCTQTGVKNGHCSIKHGSAFDPCATDADCGTKYGTCVGASPVLHNCNNPAPIISTTIDKGPCDNPLPIASTSTNYGPCVIASQSGEVKTKIALTETVQTCWQYIGKGTLGIGDITRLTTGGKCTDVYASIGMCSLDNSRTCSADGDCGAFGTCTKGPGAIRPGNAALICGSDYLGAYYTGSAPGWDKNSWANNDAGMIDAFQRFCNGAMPTVIDPTDASTTPTSNYEQLPALLNGIGVEAQLGRRKGVMQAKINASAPSGIVQEFANRIRTGVMIFNQFGSKTEVDAGLLVAPKVCSNDHSRLCVLDVDCGSGNTCGAAAAADNLDGGVVNGSATVQKGWEIGKGVCATMTATACTVDADCGMLQSCINKLCGTKQFPTTECATDSSCTSPNTCANVGVGDHDGGLINAIDRIVANAWTPFAEAYYNAIGYFARTATGGSRTALRLNANDYRDSLNPSQYKCQRNFILLVSDGSSTADRNATATSLATLYAPSAGKASGWDSTCPSYGGSKNLPILSWLAKNRNIATFSTASASTATMAPVVDGRDYITTYVVFNGEPNGLTGECASQTLLADTAANGGTTLQVASNPAQLEKKLREVFSEIEKQSASGTAASILSNSEGSGANILQAVFYPRKVFENDTAANWVGEIQNLWYYIDPLLGNSTIREDSDFTTTTPNHILNLRNDYVARFYFDTPSSQTKVNLYQDVDGNGSGDTPVTSGVLPDELKNIWRAGKLLWERDLSTSPRSIRTTINGTSLIDFSVANDAALQPYLQAASTAEADKIIRYVHGIDVDATIRPRTVEIGGVQKVWKLGDIVSSTPRLQSSGKLNSYDISYNDKSYTSYINSNDYKNRGMVYAGANDGMLHAFKLGLLDVTPTGFNKATLTGTQLGKEEWSFIPRNALPYLTYLKEKDYNHIYFVDGPTILFDASIGLTAGCADYTQCVKSDSVVTATNDIDPTVNPWRSILIGSMGIGGATAKTCAEGSNCVATPRVDPADGSLGLGYSSYFALDITDPTAPVLLWEKSFPGMGFATSGPSIVRIGERNKNGKWYVVVGSGATGPIDTNLHQFMAKSDQSLKLFILDLKTGSLVRTIDTTEPPFNMSDLSNAFSGPMIGGQIDTDRWDPSSNGYYKDDAVYFGYTKKAADDTWTDGGVMRLVTKEDVDPNNWTVSKVIDGIGPITTNIARLVDKNNKHLWLYFGSGRFFYKTDDNSSQRAIFGLKEPCYTTGNDLDANCSTTLGTGDLANQSADDAPTTISSQGWYINLEGADASFGAERVVTDAVALTNGSVFFTTFRPTADLCGFGGASQVWVTKFDSGSAPPAQVMVGKILLQLSTGTFKEVNIKDAFTARGGRRSADPNMTGKPPADPPPIISNAGNKPVKKILHIQEK